MRVASHSGLSACIITFNEADRIEACLRSVSFCDEIIVVDAHSTDGTREILRELKRRIRTFYNDVNVGFAVAQNQAIRASGAEWVLTLNPDVLLLPGFVHALVDAGDADPKAGLADV